MFARPFIDSLDFARNRREIGGEVPLSEMPRLLDALEDVHGGLRYMLRGGLDERGDPFLEVSVTGQGRLCCQRCLGAMDHPLRIEERLMLCSQAELDELEDDDEACDSILAEAHLDVVELLEEEVLLSLPIAPRHEWGACKAAGSENVPGKEAHPFAALAKLKVVK